MDLMAYLKAGFIAVVSVREDMIASYVDGFTGFDDINILINGKPSHYYYIENTLFFREI